VSRPVNGYITIFELRPRNYGQAPGARSSARVDSDSLHVGGFISRKPSCPRHSATRLGAAWVSPGCSTAFEYRRRLEIASAAQFQPLPNGQSHLNWVRLASAACRCGSCWTAAGRLALIAVRRRRSSVLRPDRQPATVDSQSGIHALRLGSIRSNACRFCALWVVADRLPSPVGPITGSG